MIKITKYNDFISYLKKKGFSKISTGKHEKWTNGVHTIPISTKHKRFSMYSAKQILQKAGIDLNDVDIQES